MFLKRLGIIVHLCPKQKKEKCSDLYPKSLNNNLKAAEHFYEKKSDGKVEVSLRQTQGFLTANPGFHYGKPIVSLLQTCCLGIASAILADAK